jgi:enhancing lycopene biosynthesis protein 2
MSVRVAVVLSGCGVYDGSEIQEAAFTLLALDQAGAEYQCCAPDKPQAEVINHVTGQRASESRNVLEEAARIARGKIVPLSDIKAAEFDAVMLPGGFGAAKNLCDYAVAGSGATVDAEVARVLREFHSAGKPIAAVCIAPVVVASVIGSGGAAPELTIGNDAATAKDLETFGARHTECPVTQFVVDQKNKIVSSPAYMYDAKPGQVFEGINKAVGALLDLAKQA